MITTKNVPGAPAAVGPYSHATICKGDMIYLSGQIPLLSDGQMMQSTVTEETQQVFLNIKTVLEGLGITLDNVVKTTVFLTDMSDFAAMNDVYADEFGDHRPSRSAFEVSKLPKDSRVEIEVIACRD